MIVWTHDAHECPSRQQRQSKTPEVAPGAGRGWGEGGRVGGYPCHWLLPMQRKAGRIQEEIDAEGGAAGVLESRIGQFQGQRLRGIPVGGIELQLWRQHAAPPRVRQPDLHRHIAFDGLQLGMGQHP